MYVLEEIVVTAERRSENLQTVPLAVTAFSADALRQQGIDNIKDITERTPGLTSRMLESPGRIRAGAWRLPAAFPISGTKTTCWTISRRWDRESQRQGRRR